MAAGAEKMLNLMEVGGSLLERVAVGNPLSLVLAASAFALSLGYLFQLSYRRHLGSEQKVGAAGGGPGLGPAGPVSAGWGSRAVSPQGPARGGPRDSPRSAGEAARGLRRAGGVSAAPRGGFWAGLAPSPQRALHSRGRGSPGPRRSRRCDRRARSRTNTALTRRRF